MQARLDRTNGLLRENLLGMRLIKAMVRYARERERFMQANEDLMTRTISAIRVVELTVPALLMVMNVGILLLLWFGSAEVQAGRAEVGEIVAVVNYAMRIMAAFSMLSWIVTSLARARASAGRITEVLKTEEKETTIRTEGSAEDGRQEQAASPPFAPDEGAEIAFERVTFRYPGMADPALERISFTVRPGQTAAILGATGSGKSSLIQLIPRLFDPDEGAVRIDGRDVRTCDPEWLRAQIGYAPQEVVLFSGTVRDNLLWGKDDATGRKSWKRRAPRRSMLTTIMRLPDQYETMLGQKGVNLSGGQKQRLSVARALLRKPRVLLLDDSTSALDAKTEAALLAALKAYRCTILLVHRRYRRPCRRMLSLSLRMAGFTRWGRTKSCSGRRRCMRASSGRSTERRRRTMADRGGKRGQRPKQWVPTLLRIWSYLAVHKRLLTAIFVMTAVSSTLAGCSARICWAGRSTIFSCPAITRGLCC